jgi:acyl-CoA synthetase (AMP-forming)/AMP-acid ligase II
LSQSTLTRPITGEFSTILDLFDEIVRSHGDQLAITDGDRRLTFTELATQADSLAQWLINERQVAPGDVVAIGLPASIDYAVAFHAVIRAGAVATGIDQRLPPEQRQQLLDRCQPRFTFDGALPNLAAGDPLARRAQVTKTDPMAIVWSFDSSGTLRGAWFDHVCLKAVTRGSAPLSEIGDRRLNLLPWSQKHWMTGGWDDLAHLVTTVVAPADSTDEQIASLITAEQVTVCHGQPEQFQSLLHAAVPKGACLRVSAITSGHVTADLVTAVRSQFSCGVVVRYSPPGSAQATGTRLTDSLDTITNTVGRNNGGVELRLIDELGTDLTGRGPDFVGTILIRSRAMVRGYWNDPQRTASSIDEDGWLDTGTLGWLGPNGNLTLCGPVGEMYIRAGNDVYPIEVERCLEQYRKLAATAVVGVPVRNRIGEIGVLFAVPVEGAVLKYGDLRTFVSKQLAPFKAPDCLVVLDQMPRDFAGAIDKAALQQRAVEAAAQWLGSQI